MCAANDSKAQSTLFFGLDEDRSGSARGCSGAFGRFALDAAEFFSVCQDKIHVLRIISLIDLLIARLSCRELGSVLCRKRAFGRSSGGCR